MIVTTDVAGTGSHHQDYFMPEQLVCCLVDKIKQFVIDLFEMIKNFSENITQFINSFHHSQEPTTEKERQREEIRRKNWSRFNDAAYFHRNTKLKSMLEYRDVNEKDIDECTPMHAAALAGNIEGMDILRISGGDLEARNMDQDTPMHLAARRGHHAAVCYLKIQGASVDERNDYGMTPLRLAAEFGHLNVVATLVAFGANKEALDRRNQTPYFVACLEGRMHVAELLAQLGANRDVINIDGKRAEEVKGRAGFCAFFRYLFC